MAGDTDGCTVLQRSIVAIRFHDDVVELDTMGQGHVAPLVRLQAVHIARTFAEVARPAQRGAFNVLGEIGLPHVLPVGAGKRFSVFRRSRTGVPSSVSM